MNYPTIINTNDLHTNLKNPDWAIVACRFTLAEPHRSEEDYLRSHIPGAVYAHLDRDLCGEIIPGTTGRHPLPNINRAVEVFSRLGIGEGIQVIAYDDQGGALAAGRLWWMLRWLGHETVAVFDGGWNKWLTEGRPVESGAKSRTSTEFIPNPRPEILADVEQVEKFRKDPRRLVMDARAAERYKGEIEPIDPVAGHIPGAINAPHEMNLSSNGIFYPASELRGSYLKILGDIPAEDTIVYCGSGVTAIHNILAMQYAGLGEARLYAGSWSEWITDEDRPIVKG